MTTLSQIAEEAGVSKGSVSAVLSGKAKQRRIAPDTCRRIEAIAQRLGYQHNVQAQTLSSGKSNLVGIMCHTQPQRNFIQARTAARHLIDAGYRVSVQDIAWHPAREAAGIKELVGLRAEGILLESGAAGPNEESYQLIKRLARQKFPLVRLDISKGLPVDVVTVNREEAAYIATTHLFELGHRRIAYSIDKNFQSPFIQARIDGYRRAHHDWGVRIDENLFVDLNLWAGCEQEDEYEAGRKSVAQALTPSLQSTAMLCSSDFVAMGAIGGALELGVNVPDDLAIMGFGSYPEARLSSIPLSTIKFPFEAMAIEAVRFLIERMGGLKSAPRRLELQPELVIGRSCGAPDEKKNEHAAAQNELVFA